jgi:hypothetical protein
MLFFKRVYFLWKLSYLHGTEFANYSLDYESLAEKRISGMNILFAESLGFLCINHKNVLTDDPIHYYIVVSNDIYYNELVYLEIKIKKNACHGIQ